MGYEFPSEFVEFELLKKMYDLYAECLLSQDSIVPKDIVGDSYGFRQSGF